MQPMVPWYRGFKGLIKKSVEAETGVTYTMSGIIEEVVDREGDTTTLRITELPIHSSVDYNEHFNNMKEENILQDKKEYHDVIDVVISEEHMKSFDCSDLQGREQLEKKFKLTTTISTNNVHLIDSNGTIKKYDTPELILDEFFQLRSLFYKKRKEVLLQNHN